MKKTYINGLGCISAQKTFDTVFLEEVVWNNTATVLPLHIPIYKDFISPVAIRRMAKGVKNGIVASTLALREALLETVDAIITGTGMGCVQDSDLFLKAMLENDEQYLTPTSFIQSTHNTVGAQIALGLQCKSYNLTYVNGSVSFESALLDAKMKIEEQEADSVLVGGIDETGDYLMSLYQLNGFIKSEKNATFSILNTTDKGVIYGEGATFFVLESKIHEHTYAEVLDVEIFNKLKIEKLESKLLEFLKSNSLQIQDIDAVILGYNGDVSTDQYYTILSENCFAETPQVYYKHLCGEYNTASAFGLWTAAKIIKTQQIPEIIKINSKAKSSYKKILLYNQYRGIDHSFTLLSKC